MKTRTIPILFLFSFLITCKQSTTPISREIADDQNSSKNAIIEGTVDYFIDTLDWVGGECDPSGFILSNYTWITNEPQYPYSRVYVNSLIDSSYILKGVRITGEVDTMFAGGVVTLLRKFPKVKSDSIFILNNKSIYPFVFISFSEFPDFQNGDSTYYVWEGKLSAIGDFDTMKISAKLDSIFTILSEDSITLKHAWYQPNDTHCGDLTWPPPPKLVIELKEPDEKIVNHPYGLIMINIFNNCSNLKYRRYDFY